MKQCKVIGAMVVGLSFGSLVGGCDVEDVEALQDGEELDELEARALKAPPPDLTLANLVDNGTQLARCGTGTVRLSVDEVNLGASGAGPYYLHLLDAATGQPAAGGVLQPALAANTSRTSSLVFKPYLGPCDTVPPCVPQTKNYDVFIDGGNLWPESDETNNRIGTLTYQTNCALPPEDCPPLVCPAPDVEPL